MLITLRQAEIFRAVMIAKSVSGGAEILHISQPAVSRVLQYTEQKLGITLFKREKGRLVPTIEALRLFDEVQSLHRHLEAVNHAAQRIARGQDAVLRIGVSPSVGRSLVPAVLQRVREQLPDLMIKLDVIPVGEVEDYLNFQRADYAVTIFPLDRPNIESRAFLQGELVCVLPPGHPLAAHAQLDIATLLEYPWVSFEPDTPHGRAITQLLAQAAGPHAWPAPSIASYVRFAESACALVENGLGIAIVDAFTVMEQTFPRLLVRRIQPTSHLTVYGHRSTYHPPSLAQTCFVRTFDELIRLKRWGEQSPSTQSS